MVPRFRTVYRRVYGAVYEASVEKTEAVFDGAKLHMRARPVHVRNATKLASAFTTDATLGDGRRSYEHFSGLALATPPPSRRSGTRDDFGAGRVVKR